MISIAGIHFAYISCCYVGQTSDKLCGRQEQPFVNRVCMKFEYITKVPYWIANQTHQLYPAWCPPYFSSTPPNWLLHTNTSHCWPRWRSWSSSDSRWSLDLDPALSWFGPGTTQSPEGGFPAPLRLYIWGWPAPLPPPPPTSWGTWAAPWCHLWSLQLEQNREKIITQG